MRVKRPDRFYPLLAFACAVFVSFGSFGHTGLVMAAPAAATSQNITMTPSSTELSIAPGGSTSGSFSAINEGNSDYSISISAAPYHVEGVEYDPQFTPLPGTVDASKWIQIIDPTTQSLAAHKLTNVSYRVHVPQGTAPGGYYGVLFAETTSTAANTGVVSHNRVGNILYITVQGPVKTEGSLQDEAMPHITMATSLPLSMLISNTGGVHFLTSADIKVKTIFGMTIFHDSLQRYVLPQTMRKISATWSNTPPIGLYRVERSATIAGADRSLPTQWIVIIHPWVLGAIGVILITIGVLVRRKLRKK